MTSRYWPVLATSAAFVLFIVILRRRFAVVTVDGQSMLPTLSDGDRVLVRRVRLGRIRSGDVVVVEKPSAASGWPKPPAVRVGRREWLIKRAAAVPGEPLPDAFRSHWAALPGELVPEGKLVVLGDNPEGSYDSRVIGFIPGERLLGIVARRMTGPASRDSSGRSGLVTPSGKSDMREAYHRSGD
jgi:signal peptidase I